MYRRIDVPQLWNVPSGWKTPGKPREMLRCGRLEPFHFSITFSCVERKNATTQCGASIGDCAVRALENNFGEH